MKIVKYILVLILLLAVLPMISFAQEHNSSSDAEYYSERYAEAYDSLLNNYYLRKHNHHSMKHSHHFSFEEFDAIPDSVLSARLQALHTVIPMTYNSEVRKFIRFYLNKMSTRLDVMLTLCEFYHPIFEEALNRYGVPEELKYLTIVESAMNPAATSRVGAAGLWQFMYSTGKIYDLEVNSVVDERRDPYKSSVAAARHLRDLYRIFDDWELAIAAYNCGSGNINKGIARSGGQRNFWKIYYNLPRETRGYIPAFTAVVYVMNYYELHGLHPEHITLPIRSDTLMIHHDAMFCYISQFTGVSMDELRTLNPQYRTTYIPSSGGPYSLCLPSARMERFITNQDTIFALTADSLSRKPVKISPSGGGSASGSKYYTVRKGDTLSKIASRNGTTVKALKKRNGLKSDRISVGQKLRIR